MHSLMPFQLKRLRLCLSTFKHLTLFLRNPLRLSNRPNSIFHIKPLLTCIQPSFFLISPMLMIHSFTAIPRQQTLLLKLVMTSHIWRDRRILTMLNGSTFLLEKKNLIIVHQSTHVPQGGWHQHHLHLLCMKSWSYRYYRHAPWTQNTDVCLSIVIDKLHLSVSLLW